MHTVHMLCHTRHTRDTEAALALSKVMGVAQAEGLQALAARGLRKEISRAGLPSARLQSLNSRMIRCPRARIDVLHCNKRALAVPLSLRTLHDNALLGFLHSRSRVTSFQTLVFLCDATKFEQNKAATKVTRRRSAETLKCSSPALPKA